MGVRFKPWPAQLYTVLPTAHHHCGISLKQVVLHGCNDMEMGAMT